MEVDGKGTSDDAVDGRAGAVGPYVYAPGARPLEGYTIHRGVGHGGFGEIYQATSDAGKVVALKLVRRNLDVELRGMRQCLNLKHANLLDLYDIRCDGRGDTWVIMEYVSGQSLEDVLAAHPRGLPPAETLAWIGGIAAGVAYLHDRGIVHRDLKPGNIFCDEGTVKVGDYGLSKFITCSRRSGHTESIGTVHYMAPEVAQGRYGREIDIYALGVILYELLTGRVPFDGESVAEVLMKHLTARPDVSMLAEPYRSIVARALEKDPAKRFHSVGEMMAALTAGGPRPREALPGQPPIMAQTVGVPATDEEPIWQAVRDGWARLGVAGKAFLLTAGLFSLIFFSPVLVPLGIVLLLFYGAYRFIRFLLMGRASSPVSCAGRASPMPAPVGRPEPGRVVPLAPPPPPVRPVPPPPLPSSRQRLTELVGSMLGGALAAIVACWVIFVVMSYHDARAPRPEQCAWLVLVSIAGIWTVLVPAKIWEGSPEESLVRRFVLLVLGFGLGLAAYCAAEMLMVQLTQVAGEPLGIAHRLPAGFYDANGRPLPAAYMAAFGTLLALPRWWRQTDRFRCGRLRLWPIAVACVAAVIATAAWDFPCYWLVMVAGSMSLAVQLASPWRRK